MKPYLEKIEQLCESLGKDALTELIESFFTTEIVEKYFFIAASYLCGLCALSGKFSDVASSSTFKRSSVGTLFFVTMTLDDRVRVAG
ncbi:MAG: hypothetical protein M0P70_07590 [Desulfobulbaceae bacterium]|nr:hypothetical protein [Desulfobulbaceae bacterium]